MKVKLGDLVEFSNGYAFKSSDYVVCSNTVNCRMSNIRPDGSFDICHNIKFLPDDFATKYKDFILNDGDIIIAMTDMAGDPKILGVPTIVDTKGYTTLMNQRVGKLTLKSNNITPEYLKYSLISKPAREYFKSFAGGGVQLNIGKKEILNIQLNLHSLREQESITQKLNNITKIMSLYQQQLQQLDELVKVRFVEMFGDPETNPNRWSISKLSEFCDLQNGYAFKSDDYLTNSTVLNCRMSNIRPDGGFNADYHPKYLPDMFWEKYKDYRLVDGDVIIAMTDMASDPKILGVPTIVRTNGKNFLLNQRVGKLTFFDNTTINNVYLMFVLSQKYIRQQLVKGAGGSTQINVGKSAVLGVEFFVPPMKLQEQFAAFVEQTDKSKFVVQQSLDKLETLKKSLMQKYFG